MDDQVTGLITVDNKEHNLKNLMVMAQEGDKIAYQELLETVNKLILAYCCKSLPTRQAAEDCCQDVLMSIHLHRHTYDPTRSFYGWIYAITKNKIVDHCRKSKRLNANEVFDSDQIKASEIFINQSNNEEKIAINSALSELPRDFRKPLVLSKIFGFSTKEISKKLDISESLVKIRVFRALRKLENLLENVK